MRIKDDFTTAGIRPVVLLFAREMESVLARNDHKRYWGESTIKGLTRRLREEVNEFEEALKSGDPEHIMSEAADVLDFVMALCDTSGALHHRQRNPRRLGI